MKKYENAMLFVSVWHTVSTVTLSFPLCFALVYDYKIVQSVWLSTLFVVFCYFHGTSFDDMKGDE